MYSIPISMYCYPPKLVIFYEIQAPQFNYDSPIQGYNHKVQPPCLIYPPTITVGRVEPPVYYYL